MQCKDHTALRRAARVVVGMMAGSFVVVACQTTSPQGTAIGIQEQSQPAGQSASAPTPAATPASTGAQQGAGPSSGILTGPIPPVRGPKRTVAVGKFSATGAFTSKYGSWDIGGGLGAMLTSALVESKRFIVVERAQVQQILSEQQLKGSGVVSKTTGPDLGNLTGVQYFVYGAVTEFGVDDVGGGFGIGGAAGGVLGGLLSGAVSHQSASGKVAMDIRVVDATTGRVVDVQRVEEPIESSGIDVSVGYEGLSLGGNKFWKTPLGQASRRALTRAVQNFAREADGKPWAGQVVDFDTGVVFINAGENSGIKTGDSFMVERIVKKLTDPATGEILSLRKTALGLVKVDMVEAKLSSGRFTALDVQPPKRGDLVMTVKQ